MVDIIGVDSRDFQDQQQVLVEFCEFRVIHYRHSHHHYSRLIVSVVFNGESGINSMSSKNVGIL
eukprot:TRINITY_DN1529_c0_g4_i1.p1 TRINITY_DN1529_c0_g4~~TRINITY_DN1529_c0_g4_i1.p1  ORF type:complete len:64 (+),score=10.06 TRINITY_DN1529_c0_g4_i1:118-309(+)